MAEGVMPFQGKLQLLERCRELEFVDDIEFLKCTRCNRLALEHWYTNCGHTLCPNCKRLLSGGRCRCPHCGQFIQHIKEQSDVFEKRVNDLHAKCPNSRYGCPLVTTVKQLQHMVGCQWTKELILPAVYRGTNTMQVLLEEMSSLKNQMGEMNGTIGFLQNELHKRQEVEEEIKKSVEMSVEDIKSHLNGLSSDLRYETTTLKVQLKDFDQLKMNELLDLKNALTLDLNHKITTLEKTINEIHHEKLKDHYVSKEEVMQLQETMTEMKASNKFIIQMLDQKEDRFSQKLTKEVEAINAKIVTSEDKMEAGLTKNRQEIAASSKDLEGKLEQQEISFNQILSNEVKQLDEKINRNNKTVEMNGKENHAKMKALKSEIKKQKVELNKQMATNVKDMQEKFQGSIEELRQQLVEVKSDFTQSLKQEQLRCNQRFLEEFKILEEKMRCEREEIDNKMGIRVEKQEVAVKNCQKEMADFSEEIKSTFQLEPQKIERYEKESVGLSFQMSHDIEKETKQLYKAIEQLNKKPSEIETNIDGISNFLLEDYKTKVETIQLMNPQLKQIEAFHRGVAIEQLLSRKSSVQELVDSFLFGSMQEKMAFEFLCFKWTIKHILKTVGRHKQISDIFPVYGHHLKAQLRLTIYSYGYIYLELCFKDEEREGQEVAIKPQPMVTFVIKDLSGHNRHFVKYKHCSFNESLQYNKFDYGSGLIEKSQWTALISPHDESMEVLVLVEPSTIMNKPLSVDGTMTDTIEHYSRKLQMAKEGLFYGHWSPVFLTHASGYRVAVWVGLDEPIGNNKRGLAAVIGFLSSEFDSQLGIEFEHETSVMLINQLDANKSVTVRIQAKEADYYRMAIASGDEIDSGRFLLNDSLAYHVTIKSIQY